MLPLIILLPIAMLLAYRQGKDSREHRHDRRGWRGHGGRGEIIAFRVPARPRPFYCEPAARSAISARLTAADYLRHLDEASLAARLLDTVKSVAIIADIASLMQAPPEVAEAIAVLTSPIEVLFAQRDMNILGAEPPVPEDGHMGPETRKAIANLQERFGQEPSGRLDAQAAAALRYATGCIYSQDKAGSDRMGQS